MASAVELIDLEARPFAAARRRTTLAKVAVEIGPLLAPVWALIRATPGMSARGQNLAVYWSMEAIEVGVETAVPFDPTPDVVMAETPAGRAAHAVHIGPYGRLGETHDAVLALIREQHLVGSGVSMEVYGHWVDDELQLRTDVFHFLVRG